MNRLQHSIISLSGMYLFYSSQSITFPTLEDALATNLNSSTPEGKKKLRQIPNTFYISKGIHFHVF